MMEGKYFFYDKLEYDFNEWNYCTIKDRRFYTEELKGLRPDGLTLLTNDIEGIREIPEGTYDVGDGYYDPVKRVICDYNHNYLRELEDGEEQWIREKCRYVPRKFDDDLHLDGHSDKIITKMIEINKKNIMADSKKTK
jgi:hypothetical protein